MIEHFGTFLIAAILLNVAPGPDHIYILSRTLAQGRLYGFISSFGVCSGALIHVLAAAFGFSLIIQSSPIAYSVLKYTGAFYLLWLGIKAFKVDTFKLDQNADSKNPPTLLKVYLQGIMVDVLNPKVAIFFLVFLPPFIPDNTSYRLGIFIFLGSIVVFIGILYEAFLIIFSDYFLGNLLKNSKMVHYLNYVMGLIFICIAVNFAFF